MKKAVFILLICVFAFSGCAKAKLEEEIEALTIQLEEAEAEIENLNDEIDGLNSELETLNSKITNSKILLKSQKDENKELKAENEVLSAAISEINGPSPEVLLGKWMGNTYENQFLCMTLDINDDWYAFNEEEIEQAFGQAVKLIYESSENDYTDLREGTVIPLLYLANSNYPNQTDRSFNITLTKVVYETSLDVVVKNNIETISGMFGSLGEISAKEPEDYYFGDNLTKKQSLVIINKETGVFMHSDSYYFYHNNFLVSISTSYLDDGKKPVETVLDTIIFK